MQSVSSSVMVNFEFVNCKFPDGTTFQLNLSDFQFSHGEKQCTIYHLAVNNDTINRSGYLPWIDGFSHVIQPQRTSMYQKIAKHSTHHSKSDWLILTACHFNWVILSREFMKARRLWIYIYTFVQLCFLRVVGFFSYWISTGRFVRHAT